MRNKEDIRELFQKDKQAGFDFSQAPDLIRRKEVTAQATDLFGKDDLSKWERAQHGFNHYTKVKSIFSREYVDANFVSFGSFFKERRYLKGNVLDIGGGWGLLRQWWEPSSSDIYIVHDPGVERFLRGVHKVHHDYYERAFSLPMTFVEGFGEELPYKNNVFNTCVIKSTLDHCITPEEVLAEAYRCLQTQGGDIIILQSCDTGEQSHQPHILTRLLKNLRYPKRFLSKIYHWLFYQVGHVQHFSRDDIVTLLEQAGFSKVRVSKVPKTQSIYAFEANK